MQEIIGVVKVGRKII